MAKRTQRRLTTIVAADIAGFSRLVGIDEEGTLAAQRGHRDELFQPLLEEYNGRIANTAGDSFLLEFPSAVEAVRCALAVQKGMIARNRDIPPDRWIQYRIGINVGDVIADGDDLLGDGVNVAARLETLAAPGGICISRTARDQVRDRMDIALEDMGEVEVKNIARPVRVFRLLGDGKEASAPMRQTMSPWKYVATAVVVLAVILGGGAWLWQPQPDFEPAGPTKMAHALPDKPAIAVLPFANLSDDRKQEYFVDGMTDDLITDLSKVSGLIVIARNSVFTYKGRNVKVQEVAKDLNVTHILEGSVRRAGDRVRINAQLIDAKTGDHLWAERYDRDLTDIFALQDDVTREIVEVLAVKLSGREEARLQRARRIDPDAYDQLLRGLEQLRRYTRATNAEAREYFEKATAIDPTFARAYAATAYTHALDLFNGHSNDRAESTRLGEAAIGKALDLDPDLPQVHFARSTMSRVQRRLDEALAAVRKGIEFDPNFAEGHAALALTLIYLGRTEEALQAIRKAMRLNPHNSFFYHWTLELVYFHLERYEEAAIVGETVVERNPQFLRGRLLLAATYGHMGRIEDAKWETEEALTLQNGMSLSQRRAIVPYKRQTDADRYIEGLRKAGLPEK